MPRVREPVHRTRSGHQGGSMKEMNSENEQLWYQFLAEGVSIAQTVGKVFNALPSDPRCMFCHSPFGSYGGRLMRVIGRDQSREDPRFCNACIKIGQEHPGGAQVDLAMVFADVRGSTPLAEKLGNREFSQLIDRFFRVSADALIRGNGLIDRLAGDEAIGFFVPGMAGPEYTRRALRSAIELLKSTGHGSNGDPWVPVGVGVHRGHAFVGIVGSRHGVQNLTALGDDVNVGARIASAAGPGEILASVEFCQEAELPIGNLKRRQLSLKGKKQTQEVAVIPLNLGL